MKILEYKQFEQAPQIDELDGPVLCSNGHPFCEHTELHFSNGALGLDGKRLFRERPRRMSGFVLEEGGPRPIIFPGASMEMLLVPDKPIRMAIINEPGSLFHGWFVYRADQKQGMPTLSWCLGRAGNLDNLRPGRRKDAFQDYFDWNGDHPLAYNMEINPEQWRKAATVSFGHFDWDL